MRLPGGDYVQFWYAVMGGSVVLACVLFVLGFAVIAWLGCALYALGHPRHWTWRRVCFALLLGPMAVGDIMQGRKWW